MDENTVTVPASAIIEAVAFMDAFSSLLLYIIGGSECPLGEVPLEAGWNLYAAAFGEPRDPKEASSPTKIETAARAEELEAELIRRFFDDAEQRATRSIQTAAVIRTTRDAEAILPQDD